MKRGKEQGLSNVAMGVVVSDWTLVMSLKGVFEWERYWKTRFSL